MWRPLSLPSLIAAVLPQSCSRNTEHQHCTLDVELDGTQAERRWACTNERTDCACWCDFTKLPTATKHGRPSLEPSATMGCEKIHVQGRPSDSGLERNLLLLAGLPVICVCSRQHTQHSRASHVHKIAVSAPDTGHTGKSCSASSVATRPYSRSVSLSLQVPSATAAVMAPAPMARPMVRPTVRPIVAPMAPPTSAPAATPPSKRSHLLKHLRGLPPVAFVWSGSESDGGAVARRASTKGSTGESPIDADVHDEAERRDLGLAIGRLRVTNGSHSRRHTQHARRLVSSAWAVTVVHYSVARAGSS
jgi:hypothetical protein